MRTTTSTKYRKSNKFIVKKDIPNTCLAPNELVLYYPIHVLMELLYMTLLSLFLLTNLISNKPCHNTTRL